MNVGKIGATAYNAWASRVNETKKQGNGNFSNVIGNRGAATNLVLHGRKGETDAEGKTVVSAWGNAITGTSTTVYKPKDFDENDPVYRVKIWDADGNVTEREVHLKEVDPANSDSFEMYAYSCYLSESGKHPNAMTDFISSHAYYRGEEGYGANSDGDMSQKVNWFEVIKGLMDMQYQLNNLEGYLRFKGFYDALNTAWTFSESGAVSD